MKRIWNTAILLAITVIMCGCAEKTTEPSSASSQETLLESTTPVEVTKDERALKPVEIQPSEDPENPAGAMQESYACAMVQIVAGNLKGSGVIVYSTEEEVWIATAAHVLANIKESAKITFFDGFVAEAKTIEYLEPQDIAVIRLPRETLVYKSADEIMDHGSIYHTAILERDAFDGAGVGDLAIAIGSKTGVAQESYAGVILEDYVYLEDFGTNMILADVYVTPGMSGGGLFDAEGRLLGIICGVAEDGEVAVAPVTTILAMTDL